MIDVKNNAKVLQFPNLRRTDIVEVHYDGTCSQCAREVSALRGLDTRGTLRFHNSAAALYRHDPSGPDLSVLATGVHLRLPGGHWLGGRQALEEAYERVGLGWMLTLSEIPGVEGVLDWCEEHFHWGSAHAADHRNEELNPWTGDWAS